MNNKYDYVFVTNVPAFYKINLFNQLSLKLRIKVIFISGSSDIRNSDFVEGNLNFEYEILSDKSFEKRNRSFVLLNFLKAISKIDYSYLVFPGWEVRELIPLMLLLERAKNAIVIESSIIETTTSGALWQLKKMILNNMALAFPSGSLQDEILQKACFSGKISRTNGVGLINKCQEFVRDKEIQSRLKYLYVGRLSEEKNLRLLVDEFNLNGKKLTVVGDGPLYTNLKKSSSENITFLGYVKNEKLRDVYVEHHVFILPSSSEPWGLVIDEALSYHLPVIVSSNVGCKDDLVIKPNTGCVFCFDNINDLSEKIKVMEDKFEFFYSNVKSMSYESRIQEQIESYIKSI